VKFGVMRWEDHRLRASENKELRRIFGSKKEEVTGIQECEENFVLRGFIVCTSYPILLG
jgi:hypothetical protein